MGPHCAWAGTQMRRRGSGFGPQTARDSLCAPPLTGAPAGPSWLVSISHGCKRRPWFAPGLLELGEPQCSAAACALEFTPSLPCKYTL